MTFILQFFEFEVYKNAVFNETDIRRTAMGNDEDYKKYYGFWCKLIFMELIPYSVIVVFNAIIVVKIIDSKKFRRRFLLKDTAEKPLNGEPIAMISPNDRMGADILDQTIDITDSKALDATTKMMLSSMERYELKETNYSREKLNRSKSEDDETYIQVAKEVSEELRKIQSIHPPKRQTKPQPLTLGSSDTSSNATTPSPKNTSRPDNKALKAVNLKCIWKVEESRGQLGGHSGLYLGVVYHLPIRQTVC